jgi:2-polyprenyl-6-methoxyphenol hydroxylase-like FAD-dependent oxidoreductase
MHVVIAGGGVGGLCLAQGLRKSGISCAVYERNPGITWSGYLLHMNADGGNGLRRCLPDHLYQLYLQTSRETPRRDLLVILDSLGNELTTKAHHGPPNDPIVPHTTVHRRTLCQIMLSGIEDRVHFGRESVGYRLSGDGVTLDLADGGTANGDVLVAADGINSAIRRQSLPQVSTSVVVEHVLLSKAPLTAGLADELPDAFADSFVITIDKRGTLMASGIFRPRREIASAAADLAPGLALDPVEDYVTVSVEPAPDGIGMDNASFFSAPAAVLHNVMKHAVADWHPGLRRLVDEVCPGSIVPKTTRRVRPIPAWRPGNVTVMGDAIHAMPPMLGDGANSALLDAAALAAALTTVAHGRMSITDAVGGYEQTMRERTFPVLRAVEESASARQ